MPPKPRNYQQGRLKPISAWVNSKTNETARLKPKSKEWVFCRSLFEAKVYVICNQHFGNTATILKEYPLVIKPPTTVYQQKIWRCDFAVLDKFSWPIILIEAKGIFTDKFLLQLEYLEYFDKEMYDKLIIVSQKVEKVNKSISTICIEDLADYLEKHH